MEDVMCDHSCSPYAKEDPLGTWRWMQHVLPQLRNKQVSNSFDSGSINECHNTKFSQDFKTLIIGESENNIYRCMDRSL